MAGLRLSRVIYVCFTLVFVLAARAQQLSPGSGLAAETPSQTLSPRVISFSGNLAGQPDGALTVTFSIYADQPSNAVLWSETQLVQVTGGKFTALLGSANSVGLPPEVFAADQAHWLGVQANGAESRYLLVSVPYAMKAVEAERLGGLPGSEYVTVQQLQAILQNSASGATSSGFAGAKTSAGGNLQTQAAAAGTPPQPATDFTDNNNSEVLLVTQQGTGYAIHAISTLQPAIYAENNNFLGVALQAVATSPNGANTGLLAQSLSSGGVAGIFDSAGPQILILRSNGVQVMTFDQFGDITANGQIQASNFVGGGFGLNNIPNSATTATPLNSNSTIVSRDQFGGFSASQITAGNFSGSGFGLTNIPNSATTATSLNSNNTIVSRDQFGSFSAGQIQAANFVGSGFGLTNIPPSAVGATPANVANSIVSRDIFGNFVANQIQAANFFGNGFGLTNIPNNATTATDANTPGAIVARDGNGNFSVSQIQANGLNVSGLLTSFGSADFSNGSSTAPVRAVLSANTPVTCLASRELLIKTDALPGQQLFICNSAGNGYILLGDGVGAGVSSVTAGDASIAIGGTSAAPSVEVANGGVTSAKLAPNSVTSAAIADGTIAPAKITGTAAILGNNTFTGSETFQQTLTALGGISTNGITSTTGAVISGSTTGAVASISQSSTGTGLSVSGGNTGISVVGNTTGLSATSGPGIAVNATSGNSFGVFASSANSTGVHGDGGAVGVDASTGNGVGLQVRATSTTVPGIPATFTNAVAGKLISGRLGLGPNFTENFSVDTAGNLFAAGALQASYVDEGTQINGPVKFLPSPFGTAVAGVTRTLPSDNGGAIGIAVGPSSAAGFVQVAYSGIAACLFDGNPNPGDYVGVSKVTVGHCSDLGPVYPAQGQQVLGRVIWTTGPLSPVLLFGPEQHGGTGGTLTSINTGAGLTGGPITSSGTISIANGGVTNAMLQTPTFTVNPGVGLSGGGTTALGGSLTLNNTGALSFNGRAGNIVPAQGDYSFSQISGSTNKGQLPATTAYTDQSNSFTGNQIFNGQVNVADSNPANGSGALNAISQNNPAALFISSAPTILMAGTPTHGVLTLDSLGNLTIFGAISGTSLSGDGSALSNVNASKLGGLAATDLATAAALNSETSSRQSADTTLQTNINSETTARLAGDAALSASLAAENSARQSDVSNLQNNINNVSAADAKLGASNTFTAGTQDFSGAGATLPVHAVLTANAPAACVAGKELLIKTDAPAGQQLFICDAGGTTWNLVGDGAAGGVSSFNGRSGVVGPVSGDYSFAQISGSVSAAQMPALTGDITSGAGSTFTVLTPTGVTAGSYTKVSVDLKGRVTIGSQASFGDLLGSASQSQLPVFTVYNNQVNTFGASQTVNGTLTASLFSGNGANLTNVNAASLNGLSSGSFAQLANANTFAAKQMLAASTAASAPINLPGGIAPSTPANGDVWNTGTVLQYRDSAATTRSLVSTTQSGGLQLLKLTASITPSSVNSSSCLEQSFTVSGVNAGDVLLTVAQPSTSSPGTNIALGGWRISAANTVAVQFCNVGKSNSTPASGTYTFALMR